MLKRGHIKVEYIGMNKDTGMNKHKASALLKATLETNDYVNYSELDCAITTRWIDNAKQT